MPFDVKTALLMVIDIQGNLALRMADKEPVFAHVAALIKAARLLDIPVVVTEQAPEKLGPTIPEIAGLLPDAERIPKKTFSCWKEPAFRQRLKGRGRSQIVLTGIETHVCVIQTALDLLSEKYAVQVVADAVSSRKESDKIVAIERMRAKGVDITTTEMIITELLQSASHPKFKEILQLIR